MEFKTFIKLAALSMLPILMWGCFEDHASQFHLDDANQVEWAPPDRSSSSLSYTATLEADQTENETITLEVQLIGAQTGSDRVVGVAVSEDGDAEAGQHFEILNSNNEVVIPANSSSGTVEVQILASNIGNGESVSTILELQDGDELRAAVNLKDLSLTIEKEEPEDDD